MGEARKPQPVPSASANNGVDERRDGGLTDPAKSQGRERDTKLGGRNICVEMIENIDEALCGGIAFGGQALDARAADAYKSELGCNEKPVRGHKHDNAQDLDDGERPRVHNFCVLKEKQDAATGRIVHAEKHSPTGDFQSITHVFYNLASTFYDLLAMRAAFILLLIVPLLSLYGCRPAAPPISVSNKPVTADDTAAMKPLGEMSWTDQDGRVQKLSDLKGKAVILDFGRHIARRASRRSHI